MPNPSQDFTGVTISWKAVVSVLMDRLKYTVPVPDSTGWFS